jgi:hypothetical protein
VFVIRAAGKPFTSRPSPRLLVSVLAVVAVAAALPCAPLGSLFNSLRYGVVMMQEVSKPGSIPATRCFENAPTEGVIDHIQSLDLIPSNEAVWPLRLSYSSTVIASPAPGYLRS